MERAYDAIVVGSGFGGGIAACRLAEQGLRVCVLERGRRFGPGDYPDRLVQFPHALWHPRHNPGGMFDIRVMRDVAVVTGAGVGGGSLVYANVQLRAPDAIFDDPAWPDAIDGRALDPYYVRTEEALQPRVTPPEPRLPKVDAFARMAADAGHAPVGLPIAVHFGEDRRHPFSGVFQQGCTNLGRCDVGCPRMSKNTVDITYVARAETHGAEVYPLHEVQRVDPPGGPGGDWRLGFRDLQYRTRGEVRAPLLVLAAGTLGSTRLLLRNRGRLARLSPALGTRYSGNGDALALALDPTAEGVSGARAGFGPVMTSRIDLLAERGHMIADGGLPESFEQVLEVLRGVRLLTGLGRLRVGAKRAATRLGLSDHALAPGDMRIRSRPPIGDSLIFLCIGRDAADGRMRLTHFRRFDVQFDRRASQALFDSMRASVAELAEAAGATAFFALDAGPLGTYVTVHPLGGCPMADDPAAGVVDDTGAVHGYDGLYVLDGSIVPTAIGVNPSKTIAALAERGAERLLAALGGLMEFKTRKTWRNHLGNQRIDPLRIYAPRSIAEVQSIVRLARERGVTVRAVGSGHSWSDVALTEGFLLEPAGLARVPAPEPDFVRPEWAGRRLVRAEGGARLKELNAWLDRNGLGLENMGGYDHQTVAGVTATSTHGSGIAFGPLNDALRSLDVVVGDGGVQRIEPSDGPTDRAAYEAHHGAARTLVQDDHVFRAVSVGIGCMGVICTAMVEVRERFHLREVRELHPWAKVRADLEDGAVLAANEHYELAFSPYDDGYPYPFLVTTRNTTADPRDRPWDKRMRNWLVEAAALFPFTPHVINLILDVAPSLAPAMLRGSVTALVKDEYDEVSFKVFNIGNLNVLPAYSTEIGVPMDGRHIEAVETIFRVARERRELGRVYQSSPIALRFVKASPAYLSMMNGRDTMMIELIGLNGNDGGIELLKAYEEALYALGGRPHWGHINTLSGSHGFVASMYPQLGEWLDVRARLDPDGVFDSPFTKRVGLSADRFVP